MRGESFGTRRPPTSAVSPLSPRRVYTRVILIGMARRLLRFAGILLERWGAAGDDRAVKTRPRAVLLAASVIHFLHDGFSETLYVFLPLWASEFGLSLTQVGLIRTAYTGGMSAFQIPPGLLPYPLC